MAKMKIEIWSDYVCPWCWIAKRRFEAAVDAFEGKDQIEVIHRAFRLAPASATMDFIDAVTLKFGGTEPVKRMISQIHDRTRGTDLRYDFDTMQFGDTINAHALVNLVEDPLLRSKLVERLFAASFSEGISIFTKSGLHTIADNCGISADVVDLAWQNLELHANVMKEEVIGHSIAGTIPLYVFDSRLSITGARSSTTFLNALREMQASQDDSDASPTCSLTGCE